jgi:hypothetical protein
MMEWLKNLIFIVLVGGLLSYLMHMAVDDITTEIAKKVARIERATK